MDGYVKLVYNKPGTIQYSKTLFEQVYSDSWQPGIFLLLFPTSPFARGPRHFRSTFLPQVEAIIVIVVQGPCCIQASTTCAVFSQRIRPRIIFSKVP